MGPRLQVPWRPSSRRNLQDSQSKNAWNIVRDYLAPMPQRATSKLPFCADGYNRQGVDKTIVPSTGGKTWTEGYKKYGQFVTETIPKALGGRINKIFIEPSVKDLNNMLKEGKTIARENQNKRYTTIWWEKQNGYLNELKKELQQQETHFAHLNLRQLKLPWTIGWGVRLQYELHDGNSGWSGWLGKVSHWQRSLNTSNLPNEWLYLT